MASASLSLSSAQTVAINLVTRPPEAVLHHVRLSEVDVAENAKMRRIHLDKPVYLPDPP